MDLPAPLEKKIGPFPVIGWIGIIGAGIGAGVLVRRSGLFGGPGKVAPVDATVAAAPVDVSTSGVPGGDYLSLPATYAGGGAVGAGGAVGVPGPVTPIVPAITTNAQWSQQATIWATSHQIDPVTAAGVISKYLQGDPISATESVVLGQILGAMGPPPEGAPAPQVTTAPPSGFVQIPTTPAQPAQPVTPTPVVTNTGGQTAVGNQTPAPTGLPQGPAFPGRNLRVTNPLMQGGDVTTFQVRAGALGYQGVATDGLYGPKTEAVARHWQSTHGLSVDGVVGPATWASFFAAGAHAA